MSAETAPPGYHPDPWSPERLRWWDGERWTDSTIPSFPALPGFEPVPVDDVPAAASRFAEPAPPASGPAAGWGAAGAVTLPPPFAGDHRGASGVTDLAPPVPVSAPPVGGSSRSRSRKTKAPLIVAVVAVVVLVAGGVAMLATRGGDDGDGAADRDGSSTSGAPTIATESASDQGATDTSLGGGASAVTAAGSTAASQVSAPTVPSASGASGTGGSTTIQTTGVVTPQPTGATASSPAPAPPAAGGSDGSFEDPGGVFRLRIGPTWEPIPNAGDRVSGWFVGPAVGGLRENVNVVTETLPSSDITIEVYLDAAIDQLGDSQPGLDVVERRTLPLASGAPGGRVEYEGAINNVPVHIVQVVAISRTTAVVATFTASPDRFAELVADVEPLMLSLEVLG
jgi:Protein of unknown function (DUF2510)